MSVYMIGAVTVNNLENYAPYIEGAFASVAKYGVEPLAYGEPRIIEGDAPSERIVMLKFKDNAAFEEWYNSQEYQSVRSVRLANAATPFIFTIDGLDA